MEHLGMPSLIHVCFVFRGRIRRACRLLALLALAPVNHATWVQLLQLGPIFFGDAASRRVGCRKPSPLANHNRRFHKPLQTLGMVYDSVLTGDFGPRSQSSNIFCTKLAKGNGCIMLQEVWIVPHDAINLVGNNDD